MKQLPARVVLSLRGKPDNFKVEALIVHDDAEFNVKLGRVHDDAELNVKLGRVFEDEDADDWTIDTKDYGLTGEGPFEVIGMALDQLISPDDDDPDDDEEEEDDADDEENEDDEDEDDEDEDEDEPEHEAGRRWHVISKTSDSVTRAMEIREPNALRPAGCLVCVELWASEEEYTSSTTFIPDVALIGLMNETESVAVAEASP